MSRKFEMWLVEWADAHTAPHEWVHIEDVAEDGEYIVRSIGWVLPPNKGGKEHHITLCQSWTPEDMVDHIVHIPVAMVRTVANLKTSKQQTPRKGQ